MKELSPPAKTLEYTHYIEYNGQKLIRHEIYLPTNNFEPYYHTILWRPFDDIEYMKIGRIQYYTNPFGWIKDNQLSTKHPTPDIELLFKETIGKDLIYF